MEQEIDDKPGIPEGEMPEQKPDEPRKCDFEATGRLRDDKGHFLPAPDKTCKHDQKPPRKRKTKKEDADTVKIRIVKDEVPPPEKNFEGRLEDAKERTATNFLKSVCFHKPRVISIDGLRYYSQDVMDSLAKKLVSEKETNEKGMETCKKLMGTLVKTSDTLDMCHKNLLRVRKSRFIWRSIAIGVIAAFISFAVSTMVDKRNAAKAKEATSQAPIEQVVEPAATTK